MLDADVVVDIVLTVVVDWRTDCYTIVVNVDVVNHIAVGVDAATIEEKFCSVQLSLRLFCEGVSWLGCRDKRQPGIKRKEYIILKWA